MAKMLSSLFFGNQWSDPRKNKGCECWRPDVPNCGQVDRSKKSEYFESDLEDIANSLMKVMHICRLRPWEVKRCKELIKRAFRHYEEVRYRVDRVPSKRFNKENLVHDLAVEAGMSRMDSQLAYGIVKRAFRAYYHGSGEGGKRMESLSKQLRHRSECLWLHAAKRTAQIFAVHVGLMYSEERQYEECIECIYKALYEELKSRIINEDTDVRGCVCGQPDQTQLEKKLKGWDTVSAATNMSASTVKTTELFFNKQTFNISKPTSPISMRMEYTMISMEQIVTNLDQSSQKIKSSNQSVKSSGSKRVKKKKKKRETKCNCPEMQCYADRLAPVITAECTQGPYVCRWVPFNEEEETLPKHHVPCPLIDEICPPCERDERSCDDECTCTCQFCQCRPAYDDYMEEAHGEKLSASGLEDHDTDYCWLAPFRDFPRVEEEEEEQLPEEELEEEENECRCTCEYKQRGWPHLFTYLAPFKDVRPKPEPEPEPCVESEQPRQSPPYGISMTCYRCWNDPTESIDEEDYNTPCPYIELLNAVHNPPKVSGINMDVTVKTQHYPTPDISRAKNQPVKGQASRSDRSSVIVKRNTIAALESNMKAVQNQKPIQTSAKPADQVRKTPPPKAVLPTEAKPAPAPAAPAPAPASANTQDDDKLTKEDILDMFGLNK
ncbi:uncharacterized protein LOC135427129 [Drosophila montana]|uniref:uncharacterized protein LOC135427129 n=1 Tax=Drosophila montana TaxID=40370 RepID=UPI00313DAA38